MLLVIMINLRTKVEVLSISHSKNMMGPFGLVCRPRLVPFSRYLSKVAELPTPCVYFVPLSVLTAMELYQYL